MACEVCEHCQGPLSHRDLVSLDGYSYHNQCHKCYVCSETNLRDAEVFKGVIFCSSCSQRIFYGCSTIRNEKTAAKIKKQSRTKRRRRQKSKDRRAMKDFNRVIEMTRNEASAESVNSDTLRKPVKSSGGLLSFNSGEITHSFESNHINPKESPKFGIPTDATQNLLRQIHCPTVADKNKKPVVALPSKPEELYRRNTVINNAIHCSDLRIAELGASTEIAYMALRKKSEMPVIIKSVSNLKSPDSSSKEERPSSDVSTIEESYHMRQRPFSSVMKIPLRYFKRHILDRSSIIDLIIENDTSEKLLSKLKLFFREEITDHQRRGMRRLYATINRRSTPHKLGWLDLVQKVSCNITSGDCAVHPVTCTHYINSHDYRCMRNHAMRVAGPTKSELACFRAKVRKVLVPKLFRDVFLINRNYTSVMMSQTK